MVKKKLLFVVCLLFVFLIDASYAQELVLLKYKDGKMEEISDGTFSLNYALHTKAVSTVTINASVTIHDADTMKEVIEVYPGQKVILYIYFNPLVNLEGPFEDLIGRDMKSSYKLTGTIRFKARRKFPIEEDHAGLIGVGIFYTIPKDAKRGKFKYKGKVKISGLKCEDNSDEKEYKVVYE